MVTAAAEIPSTIPAATAPATHAPAWAKEAERVSSATQTSLKRSLENKTEPAQTRRCLEDLRGSISSLKILLNFLQMKILALVLEDLEQAYDDLFYWKYDEAKILKLWSRKETLLKAVNINAEIPVVIAIKNTLAIGYPQTSKKSEGSPDITEQDRASIEAEEEKIGKSLASAYQEMWEYHSRFDITKADEYAAAKNRCSEALKRLGELESSPTVKWALLSMRVCNWIGNRFKST